MPAMQLLLAAGLSLWVAAVAAAQSAAPRDLDPVVVPGKSLPALAGVKPGSIVAFRHDARWIQIPVQVDERAVVSFSQIRKKQTLTHAALVYTDAATWTGADPVPTFDADDELVFMARDAGGPAPAGRPPGITKAPGQTVAIEDPLGGPPRFVYLFVSDGTLAPGAGRDYVDYAFRLVSGAYKSTYTLSGLNPETSTGKTPRYEVGFSDSWILDTTRILVKPATGVDILDRHKFQFAPGNCNRTTYTFCAGGGAMIANRDGPVRGIRSVVGANSGVITQRDWILYEGRMDTVTHLRVHPIGGTWDFYDYAPAAAGMRYHDNLNPAGVTVDGKPDAVKIGSLAWQLVTGAPGSITHAFRRDTDIPRFTETSYYDDDTTPGWNQCTGDAFAYAAAGPRTGGLPNTDPLRGAAYRNVLHRITYYEAPGVTTLTASTRARGVRNPLRAETLRMSGDGSAEIGGVMNLRLVAAGSGELVYQAGASLGTGPIAIGSRSLGLSADGLLAATVLGVLPGIFVGFSGRIGDRCDARAEIRIPATPGLVGVTVHNAFVTLDPAAPDGVRAVSNTFSFRLVSP